MPLSVGKAAQQIFTGNPQDALILQAGNPTSTTGLLYESCTKAGESWETITITADPDDPKRTPRVSVEHAQAMIALHERDNTRDMATILGLFPPTGFNAMIGWVDVHAALSPHYRPETYNHAPVAVGGRGAAQGTGWSQLSAREGRV